MSRSHTGIDAVLALLVGVLAFLLTTRGAILLPTSTDWLMAGDPAAHWLGWQFFRDTPLLQWPLGANPDYGLAIGSSIVFTDSVPLLAFLLRPFDAWLPQDFQYLGMWLLACFMLQAWFAWKLLALFTADRALPLLGAAFFAVAPILVWRLHGHYALLGQWLLVAALYLYFRPTASTRRWTALLAVAALVHAYLLLMVLAIFGADVIRRAWQRQRDWRGSALHVAICVGVLALVMWAAGYFMLGGVDGVGMRPEDFGLYHSNLLAVFDPDAMWSRLLPNLPGGQGDYEGFAWLGLGMLVLGAVALACLARREDFGRLCAVAPVVVPVLATVGALAVLALSNRVSFGSLELFSYSLPALTTPLTNAFRVAGRLFWPAFYLIYLGIFVLLFTGLKRRTALVLCSAMLLVQLVDMAETWHFFGKVHFGTVAAWDSPMQSPTWQGLGRHYETLAVVLPSYPPSANWMPVAEFAARHGMATNAGNFARVHNERLAEARAGLTTAIVEGRFDADTFYVFEDEALWKLASARVRPPDFAGTIDGFRVLAPGLLKRCSECDAQLLQREASPAYPPALELGFAAASPGAAQLLSGWLPAESWGAWSSGESAYVVVETGMAPATDLEIVITGNAYLAARHPAQEIAVSVNGHRLGTLHYSMASPAPAGMPEIRRLRIPRAVAAADGGRLLIRFDMKNPVSRESLGLQPDTRPLGLGLEAIRLEPVR